LIGCGAGFSPLYEDGLKPALRYMRGLYWEIKDVAHSYLLSRRQALKTVACGFGSLALAGLSAERAAAAVDPPARRPAHFAPRAKRVIFLFMQGGVSHVDSYDYKPTLEKEDGKLMPFNDARQLANTGAGASSQRVMKSLWKFQQHGQCGRWTSNLFPEINRHVD